MEDVIKEEGIVMEKTDCFAYIEKNGHKLCSALHEMQCKDKECRFYKNNKQITQRDIEFDIRNYMK